MQGVRLGTSTRARACGVRVSASRLEPIGKFARVLVHALREVVGVPTLVLLLCMPEARVRVEPGRQPGTHGSSHVPVGRCGMIVRDLLAVVPVPGTRLELVIEFAGVQSLAQPELAH